MKTQTKFSFIIVTLYSLFMLWWFLREDAPKLGTSPAAAVSIPPKDKKVEPVVSVGSSAGANSRLPLRGVETLPTGRVVAQASAQHIQPEEVGGFATYRWPGSPPAYSGEPVTAYVEPVPFASFFKLLINVGGCGMFWGGLGVVSCG